MVSLSRGQEEKNHYDNCQHAQALLFAWGCSPECWRNPVLSTTLPSVSPVGKIVLTPHLSCGSLQDYSLEGICIFRDWSIFYFYCLVRWQTTSRRRKVHVGDWELKHNPLWHFGGGRGGEHFNILTGRNAADSNHPVLSCCFSWNRVVSSFFWRSVFFPEKASKAFHLHRGRLVGLRSSGWIGKAFDLTSVLFSSGLTSSKGENFIKK